MESKNIFTVLGITAVVIIGFIIWGMYGSQKTGPSESEASLDRIVPGADITYYFGAECSHCEKVKKFIGDNNVRDKIAFSEKEVWHNKTNASEMEKAARDCGLDLKTIGVPFLVSHGKCFIGEPDVVSEMQREMNDKQN